MRAIHGMVMKMTLHIDEDLLFRVMEIAAVKSKTGAVDLALREFVRRGSLVHVLGAGLGETPEGLARMFDPAYDLEASRLSETPTPYGRKPRSRR